MNQLPLKSSQLSLQKAFDSTFHQTFDFNDFLNLDTTKEYGQFNIHNRTILSPSQKLKKFLRFLNSFVFDYADINSNVVFSYRRGENAYSAVEKHAHSQC